MTEEKTDFIPSSGNVYSDLGIDEPQELDTRAQIGFQVYHILLEQNLSQREIGTLLGMKQPEVSHLMNGHFSRFTTDKLIQCLQKLNRKVTIHISPRHRGEPYQEVISLP